MSEIEQKCKVALRALSDWAVTYAPEMCNPDTVEQAKARILEHGTLAYIANAIDQLHAAILALTEAEKEARTTALEEAALWHESEVKRYTAQIAENNAYLERIGSTEGSLANNYCDDQRATHRRSAAAIRALESALQSEER